MPALWRHLIVERQRAPIKELRILYFATLHNSHISFYHFLLHMIHELRCCQVNNRIIET